MFTWLLSISKLVLYHKHSIISDVSFPSFIKDEDFKSLLTKMLKKYPLNRLWKFNQIKQDPWFKDFDWNRLISFSLSPAYKPQFDQLNIPSNLKGTPYLTYLKTKTPNESGQNNISQQKNQTNFAKWVNNF